MMNWLTNILDMITVAASVLEKKWSILSTNILT